MSVIRNAAAAVTNAVFGTSSQEPSPTAQIPDNSDAESFHSAKSNISDATRTSGASYKSTTSIKSTDTQVRATSWAAKKASEAAAVAKTPLRRE